MASSQSPKATVFNRRSEPAEAPCRFGNAFPESGADRTQLPRGYPRWKAQSDPQVRNHRRHPPAPRRHRCRSTAV